ncbi:MAG: hypothetical protein RL660_2428 [Bacteroidota bacterium]|jgi:hypothetical protein
MAIRTFWLIFLKVLGLWVLLLAITTAANLLPFIFSTILNPGHESLAEMLIQLFGQVFCLGLVIYLFLFRTDVLIKHLQLEQHFFEDTIDLNISLNTILRIGLIVVGGILFINTFPKLVGSLMQQFQNDTIFRENSKSPKLLSDVVLVLIAYIIASQSKHIAAFIEKYSQKDDK